MQHFNIITRRGFLDRSLKIGLGVALSTLTDIPLVMKRALAEGNIGLNGKKLLFIFLRGANDSLNSLIPIEDPAYAPNRPKINIPKNSTPGWYSTATGLMDDFSGAAGFPTQAVRAGNGFAAVHPSLKFLAPVYNAGDLAMIHRVGYPKQSRSHFDSQNYWENGNPNDNLSKDGIFYRTLIESGLANTSPLTGISIQSALPLLFRGSDAALTNLSDPTRFKLLGIPNSAAGQLKATNNILAANKFTFPDKKSRGLLNLQYQNMASVFDLINPALFSDAQNTFKDANGNYLFPTSNAKNGNGSGVANYVVDTGAYGFFTNLKAAALILNETDAIIAGTELGGFDTHNDQITNNPTAATFDPFSGAHANLQKRVGWAIYALRHFFMNYADKATWNNTVVVTLSEFGRTTVQNDTFGTDHAEGGAMFVAGGTIKGYNKRSAGSTGIYGCHTSDAYNGVAVPWVPGAATGTTGSMFGASSRYLKRAVDYRSVLGELIRDHLGATQPQLDRIIPGYAVTGEKLRLGGVTGASSATSKTDGTTIAGELDLV
ncbi:MAG: DUF1501 domain-containing protein [Verrucomicrobiota bacterium]